MNSTIYIHDITVIDFALINNKGESIGQCARLHAEISGKVDPSEQVVIDFSKCKKLIKELVDGKDGLDHKMVITPSSLADVSLSEGTVVIHTPLNIISGVYVTDNDGVYGNVLITKTNDLEEHLNKFLSRNVTEIMGCDVCVQVRLDYSPVLPYSSLDHKMFSYSHSLKNSSSFGCQGPHGHLSYIAVDAKTDVIDAIVEEFNNCIIFNRNDMVSDSLRYTCPRGSFVVNTKQKHIFMNTDSTIENMIAYIVNKYSKQLKEAGATKLYVSEGLVKGAMVTL